MAINEMTEKEVRTLKMFIKPYSKLNTLVYKLTGGRVLGKLQGHDVMLITMTGHKSGKQKTIPLMHVPYKDGVIVVASQGGAPTSPAWHKNLEANPNLTAQFRSKKMQLRARRASDEEKESLWPVCDQHYPPFKDYRERTARNIPMYICEPR